MTFAVHMLAESFSGGSYVLSIPSLLVWCHSYSSRLHLGFKCVREMVNVRLSLVNRCLHHGTTAAVILSGPFEEGGWVSWS